MNLPLIINGCFPDPQEEMKVNTALFILVILFILIKKIGLHFPKSSPNNLKEDDIYRINDPIFGMDKEPHTPSYPSISKPSLSLQIALFIMIAIFIAFPMGSILFGHIN